MEDDPQSSGEAHDGGLLDVLCEISDLQSLPGGLATPLYPQSEPCGVEEDDDEHEYEKLDFGDLVGTDVREHLEALLKQHVTPHRVLLRDKLTFMLSTVDLFVSAYWLGAAPRSFYRLYTVKVVVLMALRWIYYRFKRWHYYMIDWCYWAQLLLLLQVWVLPASVGLSKATFAFAFGPLAWSIVAFRNSLVQGPGRMGAVLLESARRCCQEERGAEQAAARLRG